MSNRPGEGKILTSNYLNFSEPKALEKLNELTNIELKMYDSEAAGTGFHTKGYIFKKDETYRIITGSSNITKTALTSNIEWNTRIISTEQKQVIVNQKKILEKGEDRVILISSTGVGFIIRTGDEKPVNTRVYGISETCLFSYIS